MLANDIWSTFQSDVEGLVDCNDRGNRQINFRYIYQWPNRHDDPPNELCSWFVKLDPGVRVTTVGSRRSVIKVGRGVAN